MVSYVKNLLDLDKYHCINEIGFGVDTKFSYQTIHKLITVIKQFGICIGNNKKNSIVIIYQYLINVKYLEKIVPIVFEFDIDSQYIDIIYYNNLILQEKIFLRFTLSIYDEPTIKYVQNDHSGTIPEYEDKNKNIKIKPAAYLINLAHAITSFIGYNRMRLEDESYLITRNINGNEIKTKLWLYYLIKHKKSWYQKFGYLPSNISVNEYDVIIEKVREINLGEIVNQRSLINKASIIDSNKNINDILLYLDKIINIIDLFNGTLYDFTITKTLEEFTNLTNNILQSIFEKDITINYNDNTNCKTIQIIKFKWYHDIKDLHIANIIQINNNIFDSFYKLN